MSAIDPYGNCGWGSESNNPGCFTDQNFVYTTMFNRLSPLCLPNDRKLRVLEIGPGWGKFAKSLIEQQDLQIEKYTILDAAGSISHAKTTLSNFGDKIDFFVAEDYLELIDTHFDLIISIQCLSETPQEYSSFILENFKYDNIFVIDEGNKPGGSFTEYFCNFWMSNVSKRTISNFVITKMYKKDTQVAWFGRKNKKAKKHSSVQGLCNYY